jgi:hypothetical protein
VEHVGTAYVIIPRLGGAAVRQTVVLEEPLVVRAQPRGSLLVVCSAPGCTTLTMGGTCVAHDPPVTMTYARGRPYVPKAATVQTVTIGA